MYFIKYFKISIAFLKFYMNQLQLLLIRQLLLDQHMSLPNLQNVLLSINYVLTKWPAELWTQRIISFT